MPRDTLPTYLYTPILARKAIRPMPICPTQPPQPHKRAPSTSETDRGASVAPRDNRNPLIGRAAVHMYVHTYIQHQQLIDSGRRRFNFGAAQSNDLWLWSLQSSQKRTRKKARMAKFGHSETEASTENGGRGAQMEPWFRLHRIL